MSLLSLATRRPRLSVDRDWPFSLKLNATSVDLGKALYYARHEVYGGSDVLWEELQPASRAHFVAAAAKAIQDVR